MYDQRSARSPFDATAGNIRIAQEATEGCEYISPLAAPPGRVESDVIDPWSAGRDPWQPLSTFTDKFRKSPTSAPTLSFAEKFRTPAESTASRTTRALFTPSEASDENTSVVPPPVAHSVARPPTLRESSTSLSIPEAKRHRLLPPCSCEFPQDLSQCRLAIFLSI